MPDPDEEVFAGFGNVPMIRKVATAPATTTTGDDKMEEALRLIRLFLTRFGISY